MSIYVWGVIAQALALGIGLIVGYNVNAERHARVMDALREAFCEAAANEADANLTLTIVDNMFGDGMPHDGLTFTKFVRTAQLAWQASEEDGCHIVTTTIGERNVKVYVDFGMFRVRDNAGDLVCSTGSIEEAYRGYVKACIDCHLLTNESDHRKSRA